MIPVSIRNLRKRAIDAAAKKPRVGEPDEQERFPDIGSRVIHHVEGRREFIAALRKQIEAAATIRIGDPSRAKTNRGQAWLGFVLVADRVYQSSFAYTEALTVPDATAALLTAVLTGTATDMTDLRLDSEALDPAAKSIAECVKPALLKADFAHEAVLSSIEDLLKLARLLEKTVLPSTPPSLRLLELYNALSPFLGYAFVSNGSRYLAEDDQYSETQRFVELIHELPALPAALKTTPEKRQVLNRLDSRDAAEQFAQWLVDRERSLVDEGTLGGRGTVESVSAIAAASSTASTAAAPTFAIGHGAGSAICQHCGKNGHLPKDCYVYRFGLDYIISTYRSFMDYVRLQGGETARQEHRHALPSSSEDVRAAARHLAAANASSARSDPPRRST